MSGLLCDILLEMPSEPAVGICSVKEVELTPFEVSHRRSDGFDSSRLGSTDDAGKAKGSAPGRRAEGGHVAYWRR